MTSAVLVRSVKNGLSFCNNPLIETARRQRHGVVLEREPTKVRGRLAQGRLEGRMGDGDARPVRRQAEDHNIEAQSNHLLADCAVDLIGRLGALYGLGGLAEGQQQALGAAQLFLHPLDLADIG